MAEWFPWIWAVLALIFIVAEIFTAGFFIICFGIGAAAAAVMAFLGFHTIVQMAAFVIISALAVVLSRPIATRISGKDDNRVGVDRVLHKEAVVTYRIDPQLARGRVRVDREEWLADPIDGKAIDVGAKVEVIAVEGTRLKVRTLN